MTELREIMESGIPVLTEKGRQAVKNLQIELSARCRNVLVQVDGKRSLDDIRAILRGLDGLEDAITKLTAEGFIALTRDCKDLVKSIASKMLGAKAPTILKKVDDLHAKYGEACWDHLDELDKAARLFYGEVIADKLKTEISKVVQDARK